MVNGFIQDKKFHPIKPYVKVTRKKRSPRTLDGVKIVKMVNPRTEQTREMIRGVSESYSNQPKAVRDKIKMITLKEKNPNEDWVAKTDTKTGLVIFNQKPNLREGDYRALADHEFEHIDFNLKLESGNKKYENFIKDANKIEPFTPDLIMTKEAQEDAFIEGNFGILPDKRLEFPDEINSVVLEIETRQRLGLPTNVLNEDEFEKARMLVKKLHEKSRN